MIARLPIAVLLLAAPVSAQVVPTASTATAPICTDRPTKSNFACTVPKGEVQLEADALAIISGHGSDQILFGNPTLKLGLSGSSDVQLNWVPFTRLRQRDATGRVSTLSGVGDVSLRFKQRLTAAEGAFQLALLPFVKLPTARAGLGNRRVEGGVAVPVNISVPGGWTVTLGPQLDILADSDGRGHHAGVTGLFNVARQFGPFTLYNEIWASHNPDPAGTLRQASYDVALAWLASNELQVDIGANIGLTRATPGLVVSIGVSRRWR